MAGVIDTNILLYGVIADADEHKVSAVFLEAAGRSSESWYLTEGICYEFLRVSTHPKVFKRPLRWTDAVGVLKSFWAADRFRVLLADSAHWRTLEDVLSRLTHPAGNLFFDVRTVVLMRQHGIRRIYTRDTDFHRFPFLEPVDPVG